MTAPAIDNPEQACAAGHCEEAIAGLEVALRARPSDFGLHYRLGICYSGGCRRHALISPDMAVSYLRQALRLGGANRAARAPILDSLGTTLLHSSLRRTLALRAAMECHREAAEIYGALGMSDDWARAQFNLGNSCCDLSEFAGEDHWQEAVRHYEQALAVRTREKDAERHAAVLENLGTAYRRVAAVGRCISCYRRALAIFAPASHPDRNAALQNNLGNAILSLPAANEEKAGRNAARALRHFDRALRTQARNPSSRAFGITQYNRAQAYFRLADCETAAGCLEQARAAFQCCGEDRYLRLIAAQLNGLARGGARDRTLDPEPRP